MTTFKLRWISEHNLEICLVSSKIMRSVWDLPDGDDGRDFDVVKVEVEDFVVLCLISVTFNSKNTQRTIYNSIVIV